MVYNEKNIILLIILHISFNLFITKKIEIIKVLLSLIFLYILYYLTYSLIIILRI